MYIFRLFIKTLLSPGKSHFLLSQNMIHLSIFAVRGSQVAGRGAQVAFSRQLTAASSRPRSAICGLRISKNPCNVTVTLYNACTYTEQYNTKQYNTIQQHEHRKRVDSIEGARGTAGFDAVVLWCFGAAICRQPSMTRGPHPSAKWIFSIQASPSWAFRL